MIWGNFYRKHIRGLNYWMIKVFAKLCLYLILNTILNYFNRFRGACTPAIKLNCLLSTKNALVILAFFYSSNYLVRVSSFSFVCFLKKLTSAFLFFIFTFETQVLKQLLNHPQPKKSKNMFPTFLKINIKSPFYKVIIFKKLNATSPM